LLKGSERIIGIPKDLLIQIKELAEGMGFEVLHGIVDCLWVIGEPIVDFKQAVERETGILTEVDSYDWIVFLPMADGSGGLQLLLRPDRHWQGKDQGRDGPQGRYARVCAPDAARAVRLLGRGSKPAGAGQVRAKSQRDLQEPRGRAAGRGCEGDGHSSQGKPPELLAQVCGGLGRPGSSEARDLAGTRDGDRLRGEGCRPVGGRG